MKLTVDMESNEDAVKKTVTDYTRQALKMIGMKAETYAKERAPVDTGLLKNSITYALSGEKPAIQKYTADRGDGAGEYDGEAPNDSQQTVYVGTNVYYAPYQELGTSRITSPIAFLRPAMEEHTTEYRQIMSSVMSKIK